MTRQTVSVAIITNKLKLNDLLLKSIDFADEIVVVCDSLKKTKDTSSNRIKYYFRLLENDYSVQRNFALSKCNSNWVFFIDDDEYVGSELSREISQAIKSEKYTAYNIPRIDVCFHQRLLHGETGRTKLLRLAKKNAGKFVRQVHEYWMVSGNVGDILSPLYHTKNNFVSAFISRMDSYGKIDSVALINEGKPFSYWRLLLNPKAKFVMNYFFKLGFLDGTAGLFQAYLMSIQSLTVRVFQWEKTK